MVSYLCKLTGVSRSGYYNYFSIKSQSFREQRNRQDELLRVNILKSYNFKGRKKGARQIKMTLENQFKITYNLKRIRRIMKKYDIICPIRKANPYRRMMKSTKEHRVVPNSLNREFKQNVPGKILLTDITYLSYARGKRAYLSTSLTLDIAIDTIHKLIKSYGLGQSMSRRGNCWDNAPQESFSGHFKDESYINHVKLLNSYKKK